MRSAGWLLVLVALAPAAAACSLVREPPLPAYFEIRDLDGGDARRLEIEGRALGAGCELSNVHALDGDLFAYAGIAWGRPGGAVRTLRVVDLATGATVLERDMGRAEVSELTLLPGEVAVETRDWEREGGPRRLFAVDLATGEERDLEFIEGRWQRLVLREGVAHAFDRDGRLWSRDLASGGWLREGEDLAALGVPADASLHVAGARWLLFLHGDFGAWAYDAREGALHRVALPRGSFPVAIDGDALYLRDRPAVLRMALPDGAAEEVASDASEAVSVHDGRLVVGHYSPPGVSAPPPEPEGGAWDLPRILREAPGPAPLLAAAALAGAALASRRRG